MAGGIDWFRWHHGSVNDPKFRTVAKRAGARVGDVIAMWAFVLEHASASAVRGNHGNLDFESIDDALGMPEGTAEAIHTAMVAKDLLGEDGSVTAWDRRQPKRERDPAPTPADAPQPKTSTERSREHRARKAGITPSEAMQRPATPCNASDDPETPRGEESREEAVSKPSASHPRGKRGGGERFAEFWLAWPKSERKQDKAKCMEHWERHGLDMLAEIILGDVRVKRGTTKWTEGYIEAPLVYLRNRRWEDGVEPDGGDPGAAAAPWWDAPAGIRAKGVELGLGDWDRDAWEQGRGGDAWPTYRAKVFKAAGHRTADAGVVQSMTGVLKAVAA